MAEREEHRPVRYFRMDGRVSPTFSQLRDPKVQRGIGRMLRALGAALGRGGQEKVDPIDDQAVAEAVDKRVMRQFRLPGC